MKNASGIETLPCELVSWNRMYGLCRRLARQVAESFQPDLIVAVARGGFVPARVLCDFLAVQELASLRVAHYRAGAARRGAAVLAAPVNVELTGRKVLLVDDLTDTGDTLAVAMEHLRGLAPAELRCAVMQYKRGGRFQPDFCARRIRVWRWVIYPWAALEDLGAFAARLPAVTAEPEQLRRQLQAAHGVRVPLRLAEDILARLRGPARG